MRQLQQVCSPAPFDINPLANTARNWRPSLRMINRESPMSGRCFLRPRQSSAN
jgi:hypothetical protein